MKEYATNWTQVWLLLGSAVLLFINMTGLAFSRVTAKEKTSK